MELYSKLNIEKGLTSVIGSGGKTTLIRNLALSLRKLGTVIVATSTNMYQPGYCNSLMLPEDKEEVCRELEKNRLVCVGTPVVTPDDELKLTSPGVIFEELCMIADYVLVEADGARQLPLKAHAAHEPAIPYCSSRTILVVGISGIGGKIKEAAHRPEIYAELAGTDIEAAVTPEIAAHVINSEALGDTVYISQITTDTDRKNAEILAGMLK